MTNGNPNDQIKVSEVDIDNLDDLLGNGGASNVMVPAGGDGKSPKFFEKPGTVDTSVLDNPDPDDNLDDDDDNDKGDDDAGKAAAAAAAAAGGGNGAAGGKDDKGATDADIDSLFEEEVDKEGKSTGRKVDKTALVKTVGKLLEKGVLKPFDDDKKTEDYSLKDFYELIEENFNHFRKSVQENAPSEFMKTLSPELQMAVRYEMDGGGGDIRGFFRALSDVEEVRELDPTKAKDQEAICRNFLRLTDFGSDEEIEDEIASYKDRGELEKNAQRYKPKLDKRTQEQVAVRLAQQEKMRKQHEQAAQAYMQSVHDTLYKAGDLNGLKIDKRTQDKLWNGLTRVDYPSISKRPTNLFGHLIEKYQYLEPNHGLIAEALWLLENPDEYRAKIREQGAQKAKEDVARKLKTESDRKVTSTTQDHNEGGGSGNRSANKIPRNNNQGFFRPK